MVFVIIGWAAAAAIVRVKWCWKGECSLGFASLRCSLWLRRGLASRSCWSCS